MAIVKDPKFKNKYILQQDSTNEDFQEIIKSYPKFRCVICNSNTAKCFTRQFFFMPGALPITVNNKMMDGVFWINGVF